MQIGEEEPPLISQLTGEKTVGGALTRFTRYFRSAKVMQIGEEEPLFSLPIAGNRGGWQRFNLLNFRSSVLIRLKSAVNRLDRIFMQVKPNL